MKRTLYAFSLFCALALTGCQEHLDIQGETSLPELEGRTLYLRVYEDGDLQAIDSASITHGKFHFTGNATDSTVMAFLFLEEQSLMPVVIDENPLTITLNENDHKVVGSALNDTLRAFIQRKTELDMQLAELPRRESRMILEGYDHHEILMQLNQEAAALTAQEDELVTRFIKDNMDNVLAPGVFMIVTSGLPYPMLNPQIEELEALGSPRFLNDAYVKDFLKMAHDNMEKLNDQ